MPLGGSLRALREQECDWGGEALKARSLANLSFAVFVSGVADIASRHPAPVAHCWALFATADTLSGRVSSNKPFLLEVALGYAFYHGVRIATHIGCSAN